MPISHQKSSEETSEAPLVTPILPPSQEESKYIILYGYKSLGNFLPKILIDSSLFKLFRQ